MSAQMKLASIEPIKSVSQRALARYWDGWAAGRRFPAFTQFRLEPGMPDPKQLVVWSIEGEGRHLKFRALYQGENVADVFSSAWAGKTMDEVVPMPLRRVTLDAAKECARSGCAIYTIVSTIDSNERRVDCERLLLPFGSDGSRVEQILACLQLTDVPGSIRRKKILNNFQLHADLIFSGKISSSFTKTDPPIDFRETAGPEKSQNSNVSKIAPVQAEQAASPVGENRRAERRNIRKTGRISFGTQSMICTVSNISATGASIEVTNPAETPGRFTLVLEMESIARPCKVVWRKKTRIGVRFA